MTVRPGGAGEGGWLKAASDGASQGLDCEFTVVTVGAYCKKKLWQWFTIEGTTSGHETAREISLNTLRAVLESARGVKPNDKSEAAQAARKVGWGDFNQLRFMARIGVRPPKDGYAAKNVIMDVITPERQQWVKPEQIAQAANGSAAPASGTVTITRPQWAG